MMYTTKRCPQCGSPDLMSVGLALSETSPVSFAFCTRCEWKGWNERGAPLTLDSILQRVAVR